MQTAPGCAADAVGLVAAGSVSRLCAMLLLLLERKGYQ